MNKQPHITNHFADLVVLDMFRKCECCGKEFDDENIEKKYCSFECAYPLSK